jgi:hypothetical protein
MPFAEFSLHKVHKGTNNLTENQTANGKQQTANSKRQTASGKRQAANGKGVPIYIGKRILSRAALLSNKRGPTLANKRGPTLTIKRGPTLSNKLTQGWQIEKYTFSPYPQTRAALL